MTTFSPEDYFARLSQKVAADEKLNPVEDKYLALERASKEKVEYLDKMRVVAAKREAANANSWVNKAGVDPSGVAGTAINMAASVYSGASDLAGKATALVAGGASAMADMASLTNQDIDAINRFKRGEASQEDLALVNRKKGAYSENDTPEKKAAEQARADANPNMFTALELFDRATASRERSRNIVEAFDRSDVRNVDRREDFNQQLGDGFAKPWSDMTTGIDRIKEGSVLDGAGQLVSGAGSLALNTGKAVIDNPVASAEYIAENVPQLAIGAFGWGGKGLMALGNAGQGMDAYQKGMTKYQTENKGAVPTAETRNVMGGFALAAVAAEQVADLAALRNIGKVVDEAGKKLTRTGLKEALKNTAAATAKGVLEEAPTEGFQTFAEGEASLTPASAEDIYKGTVIGGVAGGGLSGGGRAAAELMKETPEQLEKKAVETNQQKVVEAAIESGDVSALLDKSKPAVYAPERAVAALVSIAKKADTTPEQKQTSMDQANEIVAGLANDRLSLETLLEMNTPEGVQKQLADAKAQLADPANAASAEDLQLTVADLEASLAGLSDPKKVAAKQKQISSMIEKVDKQLAKANEAMGALDLEVSKDTDIEALVATASKAPEVTGDSVVDNQAQEQVAKAAVRVFAMAMRNPEKVSAEAALALADNPDNGLSDAQRNHLRIFNEARIAANAMRALGDVSQEVYEGSGDNLGLANYRSDIPKALANGKRKQADNLLEKLTGFSLSHQGKAAAVAQAAALYAKSGKTNVPVGVRKTDKGWEVGAPFATEEERAANGGLNVSGNSKKLIAAINQETSAIDKTLAEMQSAYSLRFTQGTKNVTHPPQQAGTVAQKEAPAATSTKTETPAAVPTAVEGAVRGIESSDVGGSATTGSSQLAQVPGVTQEVAAAPRVSNSTEAVEPTVVEPTPTVDGVEGSKESKDSNTEITSTDQATTPEESAEQTSVDADVEVQSAGVLSVFATAVDPDAAYNQTNLIAKFWKQSAGKGTSLRPLAAVADFFTALSKGSVKLNDFVGDLVLDTAQQNAVRAFIKYVKDSGSTIRANLPKLKKEVFRYEDMMQFLLNEGTDGKSDVDQNVKVAIAYAAHSWLVDKATSPQYLKNEGINHLLLRDEKARVSREMRLALNQVQTYRHTLADELGSKVIEALGLVDSKDTPLDQKARLRMALGAHAIQLMKSQGFVQETVIKHGVLRSFQETGLSQKAKAAALEARIAAFMAVPGNKKADFAAHQKKVDDADVFFYGISRNAGKKGNPDTGNVLPEIRALYEAQKGTQDVLGKIFKVTSNQRLPSLEPIKSVPKTTAGTKQGVPGELKDTIAKDQADAWNLRLDNLSLQGLLGEDAMQAMMGVVPEEDSLVHVSNRMSVKAKNDSLKRDHKLFMEYVSEYLATSKDRLKTAIYLPYVAWKNQRVGIDATVANPQSSKYVRRMMGSPAWKTEIKSTDEKLMEGFYLRVGEGLGIKTERELNEDARDKVENLLTDEVYAKAITALQKGLQWHAMEAGSRPDETTVLSEQEKDDIVAGVAKGGENMHSFDALVAVAHQRNAQEAAQDNGQEEYTFTTELMGEVDGVANGTMLNHVLLGAMYVESLQKFLEQGGFYSEGSAFKHYNEFRSTIGNKDVYESTGELLFKELRNLADAGLAKLAHIEAIAGKIVKEEGDSFSTTSKGRNLIKGALNPLGFGSGMPKIRQKLSNGFIEDIYAGFEKLAKDGASQDDVNSYVASINALLESGDVGGLLMGRPLAFYMNANMTTAQEAYLASVYDSLVGEAMEEVVKQEFGGFIARRNELNTTSRAVFGLYDAVKQGMREAYIKELLAAGELPVNSKGTQIGDLTQRQEDELTNRLQGLVPVMKTAMSKNDGSNGTRTGILLADTERKQDKSGVYANRTQFGDGKQSMGLHGLATKETDVGVATGSAATHSTDSAIISAVRRELPVLNGHDAGGAGVGQLGDVASLLNQNTWDTLLNFSPMNEVFMAMSRVVQDIGQLVQNGNMPPEAIASLKRHLASKENQVNGEEPRDVLRGLMTTALGNAVAADKTRLEFMSKLVSVDQYAFNGSSYAVKDTDRDMAVTMLGQVRNKLTAAENQALSNLEAALYGKQTKDVGEAPTARPQQLPEVAPVKKDPLRDAHDLEIDILEHQVGMLFTKEQTEFLKLDGGPELTTKEEKDRYLYLEDVLEYSSTVASIAHGTFLPDKRTYETLKNAIPSNLFEEMLALRKISLSNDFSSYATEEIPTVFGDDFAVEVASQEDTGKPVKYDAEQVGSLAGAELGTPNIEADPDLATYFKANPKTTAKRVLTGLLRKYAKDKTLPNSEYYISLIGMLVGSVAADLPIQLITPETITAELLSEFQKNSRGWYVSKGTEEVIYVLSPEFKQSGLTPELLVHELTHAALFRIMQNGSNDPVVAAQVARLQGLMNTAKARVDKQGLGEMFGAAFTNLDEFVTWGMTNPEFQRVVLTQMTVADTTTAATLKSGLTEFVKVISNLLFGSMRKAGDKVTQAKEGEINAMSALIQNVAALLHSAGNAKTTASTVTILSMASPVARVQDYTTHDINQALNTGAHGAVFQDQLSSVLDGIVTKLHGPVGAFKEALMSAQAGTPMDIWRKALDTGAAPFASSLLKTGLPISQQEAFVMEQVEATVAAALEHTSTTATTAYRELSRLFLEVASKTEPKDFYKGDWATASQAEKDEAQATFDAIFNVTLTQGNRSDYLSRFAAFGLAHEGFNQVLKKATARDTRRIMDGKTFAERLQNVFDKILGMFNRAITHTYSGQHADAKLNLLVSRLVDIEAKRKHTLAQEAKKSNEPGLIDKTLEGAGDMLKDTAMWAVNTNVVKNSSSNAVRLTGSFVSVMAQNKMIQYIDNMTKLRDMTYAGKPGVAAGLLNNVKGPKQMVEFLVRMTKKNEKQRKHIMTNVSKFVRGAFKDGGKNLTKESKAAISNVFLRSGAYALLNRMTVLELGNLLGDKAATNKAIADVEAELSVFGKPSQHFMYQANGLAYYKATGKTNVELLMMNAHNIAQMLGTPVQGRLNASDAAKAEQLIEQLVALYAIRYTSGADIKNAREVIRDELTRSDGGNGVEFVLRMHEHQQQEALERVFKGNKTLMIHGYTPEIYNPHIEVVAASLKEGEELKYRGYEMVHQLGHDPADPDIKKEALYVLKDGGLSRFASGALSLTGLSAKGDTKHSGYLNTNNYYGGFNASTNASFMAGKQQAIADSFKPGPVPDLSKSKKVFAAPLLNENGDIVNWRYLMTDKTKDTILERTNDFDQILGTLAGATYDKETSKEQNKNILLALKEMHDAEYGSQPYSYVAISAKSDDPEMVEIWRMLSDATKQEAKTVFGEAVIYVRKDSLDAIFGYRKLSLADAFKRDPAARNMMEKAMVAAVEAMITFHYRMKGKDWDEAEKYAKRAAHIVTKSERIWQELVHEVKDIIVVKTGTVMVGNIWSNLSMLYLKGVPLMDIARHHMTAFRGAVAYKKDTEQLEHLRYLLATKQAGTYKGGEQQIHRDMARLQDAIDRSPVKELMDAGLMPTIVEDVAADDDQYSYKSALTRKVDALLPAKAGLVMKAARHVYMAHDTPQYKFLAQTTQLSDFVARYTLYQHQTTRKKGPLSKQAAISEASETFVNYDMPMQRNLQYLDDMGLTPFMKYFLNIQRVLAKTVRENPGRVLSMIAMGQFLDLGPIVLESSAVTRVGNNPLQWGALKLPGSLDDLATVNAVMTMLK